MQYHEWWYSPVIHVQAGAVPEHVTMPIIVISGAALAAAVSAAFETATPSAFLVAAPEILFAGLVSGALGYTLAIIGQRHTPPAEAALILSLESVFAALAGAVWLGERLIPVRLITDACPISMADGLDSFGIVNEETPSLNASLDDFVVGVPDQGAELIFA
jgi:threonine/homoserine efflux transporter RhtA